MALPEAELVKLPGYWKDAEKSRAEAQRLLKEAGQENLAFKFLNRSGIESYTTGGVYAVDQWRRIGVKATHEQLETKLYQENLATGNFDVGMEFISDYLDDPTQNFVKFLSKKLTPLGYSGHEDTKIDDLYEKQRRTLDPVERTKIVRQLDSYVHDDGLFGAVPVEPTHRRHAEDGGWLAHDADPLPVAGPRGRLARSVIGLRLVSRSLVRDCDRGQQDRHLALSLSKGGPRAPSVLRPSERVRGQASSGWGWRAGAADHPHPMHPAACDRP